MKSPRIVSHLPLVTLENCGGYYNCPKGPDGKRLGPLVGYAGRDEQNRQKVGDVYYNFAKAEQWPHIVMEFGLLVALKINTHLNGLQFDVLLGMPMGGIVLAQHIGLATISGSSTRSNKRVIFAEKKGDDLIIARHDLEKGDRVMVVEDVCNNFSTTTKAVQVVEAAGATVVAIACFLNRSPEVVYEVCGPNIAVGVSDAKLPVISLVHHQFLQYLQDDLAVAEDIAKGNVVWKPKHEWDQLKDAMNAARD